MNKEFQTFSTHIIANRAQLSFSAYVYAKILFIYFLLYFTHIFVIVIILLQIIHFDKREKDISNEIEAFIRPIDIL